MTFVTISLFKELNNLRIIIKGQYKLWWCKQDNLHKELAIVAAVLWQHWASVDRQNSTNQHFITENTLIWKEMQMQW